MRRGVAAEQHAVFAIADRLLHKAELGPAQPAARQVNEQQHEGADFVKTALSGRSPIVEAEDEFEIGETVVAAEEQTVSEKEQASAVGKRLGQNREINAADARAERQRAKEESQHPGQQESHQQRKRKTGKWPPEHRQFAPAEKHQEIRDRLMILAEVADH